MDKKNFIKELKNGKEKAYEYLVDLYYKRLYGYALSLTDDHAMAQDILQNTFLKTWQYRRKLSDKYSLDGFLFKLVYNEFVNTFQKNKFMLPLQHKYVDELHEILESTETNKFEEIMKKVEGEIQKLPPKCQHIFLMSKREGLTNKEISDYLKISIKAVEAQISKAYTVLRQNLEGELDLFLFLVFGNTFAFKGNPD